MSDRSDDDPIDTPNMALGCIQGAEIFSNGRNNWCVSVKYDVENPAAIGVIRWLVRHENQQLSHPARVSMREYVLAAVIRYGGLDVQVCVPSNWSDADIIAFAELQYPCGTQAGWQVRKDQKLLAGAPERNPCEAASRPGFVHVTLDA